MNKEDSLQLKGIAVLMMLWTHLFSDEGNIDLCQPLLYFYNGEPFAFVMRKICSLCVPIFIFIGGYGLMYKLQTSGDTSGPKRAMTLYRKFWFMCMFLLPFNCWNDRDTVPGSLRDFILNMSGLSVSYNGAWWFLLPYAIITFFSKNLLQCLNSTKRGAEWTALTISALLLILGYFAIDTLHGTSIPVLLGRCLCSLIQMLLIFYAGGLFAKHDVFGFIRNKFLERFGDMDLATSTISTISVITFISVITLRLVIGATGLLNPPFVLLFITSYTFTRKAGVVARVLSFLGTHSTYMWLIHMFFCTGICGTLLFRLHYPILIYSILVATSLLFSIIIGHIYRQFEIFREYILGGQKLS